MLCIGPPLIHLQFFLWHFQHLNATWDFLVLCGSIMYTTHHKSILVLDHLQMNLAKSLYYDQDLLQKYDQVPYWTVGGMDNPDEEP